MSKAADRLEDIAIQFKVAGRHYETDCALLRAAAELVRELTPATIWSPHSHIHKLKAELERIAGSDKP